MQFLLTPPKKILELFSPSLYNSFMTPTQFIITVVSIIALYLLGAWLVYRQTNQKVNDQNIELIPEEAQMLMGMILLYPLYYSEIDIILKHANRVKVKAYDPSQMQ